MAKKQDVIKVAADVGKGIAVHAKGNPAQVVAVGAAAGIAVICVAIGYGTYVGITKVIKRVKK